MHLRLQTISAHKSLLPYGVLNGKEWKCSVARDFPQAERLAKQGDERTGGEVYKIQRHEESFVGSAHDK